MVNLMVNRVTPRKYAPISPMILFLAGISGFMPSTSNANVHCDIDLIGQSEVRVAPVIIYNTDLPGTVKNMYSRGIRLDCSIPNAHQKTGRLVFEMDPNAPSNLIYPEAFDTNLAGVGITFAVTGNPACAISDKKNIICSIKPTPNIQRVHFVIQRMFFKTDSQQAFGIVNIPQGNIKYYLEENGPAMAKNLPGILDAAQGLISKNACTLNTPTINFNLGEHQQNSFSGIGSTGREITQPIILSCHPNTKYILTVNGKEAGAPGVIKLTQEPNMATGIGVQLLTAKDNQPIILTAAKEIGISANTPNITESIDIIARYYQTDKKITPGSANASATFTVTYQ